MTVSHAQLTGLIEDTGIWAGSRRQTHSFVPSPDLFELSEPMRVELDRLARALDRGLLGASRLMAIAADSSLHRSPSVYTTFARTLGHGAPYNLGTFVKPSRLPLYRKLDLVPSPTGLMIVEIDATNPRGLGYTTMGRLQAGLIAPDAELLPGAVAHIATYLHKQGVTEVTFLYGDRQRFYLPEFEIVARAYAEFGITLTPVNEVDVLVKEFGLINGQTDQALGNWFVDLPFLSHNGPLVAWFRDAVRDNRVNFVVPPKHFLSSKALLALFTNPVGNPDVEALLRTQIDPAELDVLRAHIPATYLVDKTRPFGFYREVAGTGRWVLKASVSSGMKGVVFSDEEGFDAALASAAASKRATNILQAEVPGREYHFTTFDAAHQPVTSGGWHLRLIAMMGPNSVLDCMATARQHKAVHGAPDAILTGVVRR